MARVRPVVCLALFMAAALAPIVAAEPPAASRAKGASGGAAPVGSPLAGAAPLTIEGDISSQLVEGVDRFLVREIDRAAAARPARWRRDFSSTVAYEAAIEPHRARLARMLGVRDPREPFDAPALVATTDEPALVGRGPGYEVFAIRWPALAGVEGEGLLLMPTGRAAVANVIALPDAEQTPEQLVGLTPGVAPESQFAARLAQSGCRVVAPLLINRALYDVKVPGMDRGRGISNREFLHRAAFELGRGLSGYELQKLLALVDWLTKPSQEGVKLGVVGYGEGARLALLAAALDRRIAAAGVSGYFGPRERVWQEPIDRNAFGLLNEFGDAELAAMIAPRTLVVEACRAPEITLGPSGPGAPAEVVTPPLSDVEVEFKRAVDLAGSFSQQFTLGVSQDGRGAFGSTAALRPLLAALAPAATLADSAAPVESLRKSSDPAPRHARQMQGIVQFNEQLLAAAPAVRKQFMSQLDTSTPEKFAETSERYRQIFYDETIGRFDQPLLPPNARTRLVEQSDLWTRYEVVLDVFPDVIAYGLLTVPNGIAAGRRRPVVVCQHGLESRPQDVIGEKQSKIYAAFATRLAERGYITFAPQNLYIFEHRFRTLQRKANAIGKTLFSVMVPQHQQITDWLASLPMVDGQQIGFYGLSYGGKSAMRIPPLVKNYALSICSGDFNEWVVKVASTRLPFSYVWTKEYEMCEFDLGGTFDYAEMATLIAPRPFMVERGRYDGVGADEWVAYEFAKVASLYDAKLRLPDRCEIEWFNGPHTINGVGTFKFLDKHLGADLRR